jgi:hypothetical protein
MSGIKRILAGGVAALGIAAAAVLVAPLAAHAATSNTPVWIGAPYAGSYKNGTRPGQHGGNQVAFDFYASAGTTVKVYAAPKNSAYDNQITAHITQTGVARVVASETAAQCGYYAVVQIRHNGNEIGQIKYAHLASAPALGQISRWGGTVGTIAALPFGDSPCYQVSNSSGRHIHIELRSYGSRPACGHDYGAVSLQPTNYIGYIGDYGKAPLSGNRCPSGI